MSALRALQEDFLAFLLSGDRRIAEAVVDQAPVGRDTRLGIYASAYRVRLQETLETDHEVLGLYLGDDLWEQMAAGYIDQHPSTFRSLRQYGDALPEWLRRTPPFADYPQIAEMALFERRLLVSFDAGEAHRAATDELAAVPTMRWPDLKLRFHPSVQPLRLTTNCVAIWKALKAGEDPPEAVTQAGDPWWLLWRGEERLTQFRPLPEEESEILHHFLAGGDFAGACELLVSLHGEDRAARVALELLTSWLDARLVRELVVG